MAIQSSVTGIVTDTMMEAAELLRERLTERQNNALWESMLHITSMELTDADRGIVDADPPNKEHKQLADGADCEVKS